MKDNFDEYSEELRKPWPGMAPQGHDRIEEDINLLLAMFEQEQQEKGREPSTHIENLQPMGDQTSIMMPEWLMSAFDEFRSEFGPVEGDLRFEKTVAVFLDRLTPTRH